MTCTCRASSLRIFVQSLTRIPLSHSLPRSTPRPDPRLPGASTQLGRARPFTAASAVYYPRQTWRAPGAGRAAPSGLHEQSGPVVAADADAGQLEKAKTDKAVFEFSPDAIDALAAELGQTPKQQADPSGHHGGPRHKPDGSARRKPELPASSKLRRSKIMPPNIKRTWEQSDLPAPKKEPWMIQKEALRTKFPDGWNPRKRLSPDALEGIRALHTQYPEEYTTEKLSQKFEVSPEVIRRILRAKWRPTADQEEKRMERWFNRGKNIWSQMAELGTKPPKKWREEGIVRDPSWNVKRGPRTEYPYAPRKKAPEPEDEESTQRKLGEGLL
ncbi:hypothetical protein JX266_007359 [Neoarthrinium moseri]|nr:hypothetical protein JX266_007359 [Neoarthrinium moseri]